jgi:hypothetical protein
MGRFVGGAGRPQIREATSEPSAMGCLAVKAPALPFQGSGCPEGGEMSREEFLAFNKA